MYFTGTKSVADGESDREFDDNIMFTAKFDEPSPYPYPYLDTISNDFLFNSFVTSLE